MSDALISIDGAEDTINALQTLVLTYPKVEDTFLKQEANKLRNSVRSATKSKTKKKTGTLLRGVTRSKKPYSIQDERKIRVYSKAHHAHLIEYGHKPNSRAYNIFHDQSKAFDSQFVKDAESMVNELLNR